MIGAEMRLKKQGGFSLLEVMVSVVIMVVGLLGLAAMQAVASRTNFESYQRAQALVLLDDITDRMNANRKSAQSFVNGTSAYFGTGATASCSLTVQADCVAWNEALSGASEENSGGTKLGAMINARGCIEYDAATEVSGRAGTGLYRVTVVWQGADESFAPPAAITCGTGLYGTDNYRRTVTRQFRVADLA